MGNIISGHHKTRSRLDMDFIDSIFDADEREKLDDAQKLNPNSIIRMPCSDLSTRGIKGSVPAKWDGSIAQLR